MAEEIEDLGRIVNFAAEFIVNYGFQIIGAIIILFIGWLLSNWVAKVTLGLCERTHLDITLSRFFSSLAKALVLVFVIIIALGKFGITITPFIAALGAVVFGGTLALQGPLSNYGAGLTIIMTRPFVVGDTIRIQGVSGVVEEIKMAYTQMSNEDGERITIPNRQIVGEILCNSFSNLVVESIIRISYGDDPQKTVDIIKGVLMNHSGVADKPVPLVGIEKFGESAFEIGLRYWLPTRRYHELLYSINGEIHQSLNSHGIQIAHPQLGVHVTNSRT